MKLLLFCSLLTLWVASGVIETEEEVIDEILDEEEVIDVKMMNQIVCPKGKSARSVKVDENTRLKFETNKGKKFQGPTRCIRTFKPSSTNNCMEWKFSCSKSKLPNKSKNCKPGNRIDTKKDGDQRPKRYCKFEKPSIKFRNMLKVTFIATKGKFKG